MFLTIWLLKFKLRLVNNDNQNVYFCPPLCLILAFIILSLYVQFSLFSVSEPPIHRSTSLTHPFTVLCLWALLSLFDICQPHFYLDLIIADSSIYNQFMNLLERPRQFKYNCFNLRLSFLLDKSFYTWTQVCVEEKLTMCMCVCVCVSVCMRACMRACVYVCERERGR